MPAMPAYADARVVGENIRQLRFHLALTQEQFGAAVRPKPLSQALLSTIESGECRDTVYVRYIAETYGVSIGMLLRVPRRPHRRVSPPVAPPADAAPAR